MKLTLSAAMALLATCAGFSQTNIASLPDISPVQAMGGKVFFSATHDTYGQELFVSNGNAGNFSLVKDINPGRNGSTPGDFTVLNNELFFTAYSSEYGFSLWKSDGTSGGTKAVYTVKDASPQSLFVFKNKLYFTTSLGTIIQTDGTPAGTKVFYQADFTWGRIQTVIANDEYIYFTADGRKIFRDNGTSRISFLGPLSWEDVYFKELFIVGNSLVAIKASTYDDMIRIYALGNDDMANNGDAEWPVIKKLDAPIYGSQYLANFTSISGKLFFNFRTNYDNTDATDELWITDGTEAGTKQLKSFSWNRYSSDSEMNMFYSLNGKLFFRGGSAVSQALWTSDGTPEGTVKFHDVAITRPYYNYEKSPLLVVDNQVYFSGTLGSTIGLWTSDGTAAGTKQVFSHESMGGAAPYGFAVSNDLVYFVTSQQYSSTLWSSLPAADISVSSAYSPISSGESLGLFWGAAVGSCQTVNITIANKGLETLYLDQVTLSGKDFYLVKQTLPEKLAPDESVTTQVVFNPITTAKSTATLTILSSDGDESRFTVYLSATASNNMATKACQFDQSNYVKNLTTDQPNSAIVLSPSTIAEGEPTGTVIGEFMLPANGTFSLVSGEGDTDNKLFVIDGKSVKSNAVFNFDLKSLYSIRVGATSGGNDVEASLRIRVTNGSRGFEEGNCRQTFEYMNFSYLALEANAEGHLFATTSNGKILRSKDDGQHWEVVYAGSQYLRLSEITFIGNTAIVQGSYALLKSDDGGATWFHLYLPITGQYYYSDPAIFFFDEQTGYAATSEGEIFFTNDGGRTWETRLADSWLEFRNLFFLSAETGFATSGFGDLYKTADGGKSWTGVDLSSFGWGTRVRDLWFTNDSDGFLLADYYLYRTSDGGETWIKVPEVNSDLGKIKFYGEDVGYVYSGGSVLHKTSDGGKTWTTLMPGLYPAIISGVAAAGSKIFIANKGYYSNESARALAVSSNNGATWSRLNYFSDGNIYGIDFSTGNKGYIIGESGFFKTEDNGLTWDQAVTDLSAVGDIFFIDDNTIILLSGGHLYKSTNGGVTTRNVLTTPQSDPYRPAGKLYSAPGNILFSVSWYAVYRSNDLGETWTLVSTDPGYYTQGMHFVSSTVGYRIELFGSVEKTTNGGQTWTRIFTRGPEVSDPFNAIFYLDENLGYSGGAYLRKTVDGGKTWQKINWPFYDIIAIHFENETHGYVATRGGNLYETRDASETWQEILSTSSTRVADVQFRGNEIFIAGENGLAVRTNTTPRPPAMPGYISGPQRICAGDAVDFHLAIESGYQTQWSTTAGNMEDHNEYATISFPSPGEYTITARHFNACGTSDLRTTTVAVSTPQDEPIIDGPNPATLGEQDVAYTVTNGTENASYLWEATGSTNISPSGNTVLVDWATRAESGEVRVLSIDASGCRSYANLAIILDVPVSIESELTQQVRVYPNPTAETDTKLVSSYNGALSIRIIDVVGREYLRTNLNANEEQSIPTRRLPAGLYLIEIFNGTRLATKKLIKQ